MPYSHLAFEERYVIYHLVLYGLSYREIGRRLGRHHTTISREVNRNRPTYADDAVYWNESAQQYADQRKHQPRHIAKRLNTQLVDYVRGKLELDWSPEQISGRLQIDFADNKSMQVSHEAIYQWIYLDASIGGSLYTHLRCVHKKRRKQKRYGTGRGLIPGRVSISERPAAVDLRERFGDWEGDSVEGSKGSGAIASHVERKSRYLIAAKLADKKADTMAQKSIKAFWRVPKAIRKTLTVDNGKEFSFFKQIEDRTGLRIYFADPYAAWQRGLNENTNKLLRQYFPKGMDFRKLTDYDLALKVKLLNNRPRKCLNYQTPKEVYRQAWRGALAT
jgi:transposase, IS30 family